MGPEKKFAQQLRKSFQKVFGKNGYIFQALVAGPGMSGVPDRYVVAEGRSALLELKVAPRKLTKQQEYFLEKANKLGGFCMYISLAKSGDHAIAYTYSYGSWSETLIRKVYDGRSWHWDVGRLMELVPRRVTNEY